MLERAIKSALSSSYLLTVIVSTDSDHFASKAVSYGARVPRLRPDELSTDNASAHDVWKSELIFCESYFQKRFDISIFLEPTSPLRTSTDIDQTIRMLIDDSTAHASATVSLVHGNLTPHKLHIPVKGFLNYFHADGIQFHTRQNIANKYFWRNGACYATRRSHLLQSTSIFTRSCKYLVIDRPMVSIDSLMMPVLQLQ